MSDLVIKIKNGFKILGNVENILQTLHCEKLITFKKRRKMFVLQSSTISVTPNCGVAVLRGFVLS
jgi:hypothetical protein